VTASASPGSGSGSGGAAGGAGGDQAGPLIADLITKELDAEQAATDSLQSRGLAVISSSGTLVTLLFGLSAVATTSQHFKLPAGAKPPLYVAAVLLVLAAISGIATNAPRGSKLTALRRLGPLLESPYWEYPAGPARREVAKTQLAVAEGARAANRLRARFLLAGIVLEIAGIASTMVAVIVLIANG
jgi:hypothetical protein